MAYKKNKSGYSSFWVSGTPTHSPMYYAEKLYDLRNFCHGVFKVKHVSLDVSYKTEHNNINHLDPNLPHDSPLLFDQKVPRPIYKLKLHGNPKPSFLDTAVGTAIFDSMVGNYVIFPMLVPTFKTVQGPAPKKKQPDPVDPTKLVWIDVGQGKPEFIRGGQVIVYRDMLGLFTPDTGYFCTMGTFPRIVGETFRAMVNTGLSDQHQWVAFFNFVHKVVSSKIAMLAMEKEYPGWSPYFQKFYSEFFGASGNILMETPKDILRDVPMLDYILAYGVDNKVAQNYASMYTDILNEQKNPWMRLALEEVSKLITERVKENNFVLPTIENNWVFHLSMECYRLLTQTWFDKDKCQEMSAVSQSNSHKPFMGSHIFELVDNMPEGSHSIQVDVGGRNGKIKTVTTDVVWLPTIEWFNYRTTFTTRPKYMFCNSSHIDDGYELGELLCRKLAYIGEPEEVNSFYKTKGKINKAKLHRVGLEMDDFFKETYMEVYPESTIYLSVDFSGSMCNNSKWDYCVTMLVALAYVSKKIPNIRVVCDLRYSGDSNTSNVVIFDSKVSRLDELESLLLNISPSGGTPETLLYEFPCRTLEKIQGKKYFITLTDGQPSTLDDLPDSFHVDKAHEVYQRIKAVDGEMLAYFINGGGYSPSKIFTEMYGDNGKMHNPTELHMIVEDVVQMIKKTSVDLVH